MEPLKWFAAPFHSYGETSGEGALRLLGQPSMDPLAVLARETIQNSWDARLRTSGETPRYELELRDLTGSQRSFLTTKVFGGGSGKGLPGLTTALKNDRLRVIRISDQGTRGLAGPIRADLESKEGQPTDFIDFVFKLGSARDTPLGGGTYGFGKTIAYVVSRASTMVVASCVQAEDSLDYRFIASAIGAEFGIDGKGYTGRQWWGRRYDGRIGPLVGRDAELAMAALGIKPQGTGTTLLILDPELRRRSPQDAMSFLTSAILWNAWPKMLEPPGGNGPAMRFSAKLDAGDVPVPLLESDPRLRPFLHALQLVRARQDRHDPDPASASPLPSEVREAWCGRPKQKLGHLGIAYAPYTQTISEAGPGDNGTEDSEDRLTDACPFYGPPHHTALMRQAELVVTYREGPPSPVEGFCWGGVFRTLPRVDDHFAMAEPPAHDGWDPEFVKSPHGRTFVRAAFRRIKEATRDFLTPSNGVEHRSPRVSTAEIGDMLAGIVPSVVGTAAGSGGGSGGSESNGSSRVGRASARVVITGTRLVLREGRALVEVDIELTKVVHPFWLVPDLGVRNDTGRERSAPEGVMPPKVLELVSKTGKTLIPDESGRFTLSQDGEGRWTLLIDNPEAAALDLRIEARSISNDSS